MQVLEGWTGPGRRDATIQPLTPPDDGLHLPLDRGGQAEWWYFDAHLESGHTLVVFFHAANPNPGREGQTGLEMLLLSPDGARTQHFFHHPRRDLAAAPDRAEVTIGRNTLRVVQGASGRPVYTLHVEEPGMGCQLTFTAEVDGWKPGDGLSRFGKHGFFGWTVPCPRASVSGTIEVGADQLTVSGTGYHDHNWLNFPFPAVLRYWMWGRVYSRDFSLVYAIIQCNARAEDHLVKVLMLAEGSQVLLSSGEWDFTVEDLAWNPKAGYHFPRKLVLLAPGELTVSLQLKRVLEAQDMLEYFPPLQRFILGKILRLKPGYFRLLSEARVELTPRPSHPGGAGLAVRDVGMGGGAVTQTGTALHDLVLFKPFV